MKNAVGTILVLALIALAGCSQSPSPTSIDPSSNSHTSLNKTVAEGFVPNSYIIILSSKLQTNQIDAQLRLDATVRDFSTKYELQVTQHYTSCLLGFAGTMNAEVAAQIAKDPRVQFVEQDRYIHAYAQSLPTGITRIGGQNSSTLSGNGSGSVDGVDLYIIDSGVQYNHPDLNVVGGICYVPGLTSFNDQNGHGTHVAGTAAARDNTTYVVGIAPGAPIYSVRVLDATGNGQFSWALSGVNWVTSCKQANPSRPAVANMSLGGYTGSSTYNSLDLGVQNSIAAGITYTIASGNNAANAVNYSPAHVTEAITVGAYNQSNNAWYALSNFGSCVDILAPGVNVLSTWIGTTTSSMSGTSMAAPHVAGTAVLYLNANPSASPAAVTTAILYAATHATKGTNTSISGVPAGTITTSVWAANF